MKKLNYIEFEGIGLYNHEDNLVEIGKTLFFIENGELVEAIVTDLYYRMEVDHRYVATMSVLTSTNNRYVFTKAIYDVSRKMRAKYLSEAPAMYENVEDYYNGKAMSFRVLLKNNITYLPFKTINTSYKGALNGVGYTIENNEVREYDVYISNIYRLSERNGQLDATFEDEFEPWYASPEECGAILRTQTNIRTFNHSKKIVITIDTETNSVEVEHK